MRNINIKEDMIESLHRQEPDDSLFYDHLFDHVNKVSLLIIIYLII